MKDLKERTLRSGVARISSQAVNFLLRIGSLMVLARLLDPKDFGLVAMVTAVSGLFALFKDAGLSMAAVQRAKISNEESSALFWTNMLVGAVLAGLLASAAPVLVHFYQEKRLFLVAVALAPVFIFAAASAQHSALLQREMRFGTLAAIDNSSLAVGIGVGIAAALAGWGYWALVAMAVCQPVVSTVCMWLATRWIPGAPRWGAEVRSMINFGGTITLNRVVTYVAYNLDKILLGRFWGAEALGVYGRAYQLINIPTSNLNSAVGDVAFSALSRIQDDPNRIKRYFLKGYSLLLSLTLPITIACAVFAADLIHVILGPKWEDAVGVFQLLSPTILIFGLINPMSWLLYATGRVGRSLRIALVIAPLVITAYFVGLPYGPSGVAAAYSTAMALWVVPHILWCIHGTPISFRELCQTMGRPLVAATASTLLIYVARVSYGDAIAPLPRLVLEGGLFVGLYVVILLYVFGQRHVYADIFRGLTKRSAADQAEGRSC